MIRRNPTNHPSGVETLPFALDEYVTDPVLKVLIDADALLSDESKWCKGMRDDGMGRLCIHGALGAAATGNTWSGNKVSDEAWRAIRRNAGRRLIGSEAGLAAFNNASTTKFPDIKALFAKAIAAQRQKAGEAVYPGVGR